MTKLTPQKRTALPIRVIVIAIMLVALVLGIRETVRDGFYAIPQSLLLVGACAAISFVLVVEARRQLQCELTELGFVALVWTTKSALPFVGIVRRECLWSEVVGIGRAGYSLVIKTQMRPVRINLFLFENPEAVEKFAFDMWRENRAIAG